MNEKKTKTKFTSSGTHQSSLAVKFVDKSNARTQLATLCVIPTTLLQALTSLIGLLADGQDQLDGQVPCIFGSNLVL